MRNCGKNLGGRLEKRETPNKQSQEMEEACEFQQREGEGETNRGKRKRQESQRSRRGGNFYIDMNEFYQRKREYFEQKEQQRRVDERAILAYHEEQDQKESNESDLISKELDLEEFSREFREEL